MKHETLEVILLVIGMTVLSVVLVIYYFYSTPDTPSNVADSTLEKCKPQGGYSEEEWIIHMEHHPAAYKECLSPKP